MPSLATVENKTRAARWLHRGLVWACWLAAPGIFLGTQAAVSRAQFQAKASTPNRDWNDPSIFPDERARRALEAANALDDQGQRAPTTAASRARWLEAATTLDQCLAANPTVEAAPTLQFQAAVYLWARSRATLDTVDLLVASNADRIEVARGLDEVVARLRVVLPRAGELSNPFAQNVRFRLAQALADRARLRPELDPDRVGAEKEAQSLLDRSITSPRLRAFARVLHAELANRLDQFGPAQVEAEEAAKLDPPAPLAQTTEVRIHALAGRGQFAEAAGLIDRAAVPTEQKTLWKLRLALARRKLAVSPRDLVQAEAEAFTLASTLRTGKTPEARRGLMELSRAIDTPGADAAASCWDLLVEGRLLLLEPEPAAQLATRGADHAQVFQPEQAAPLRFKAGACWFQAEKFSPADTRLSEVCDDPSAPTGLRAKAGMLRALCRGRALASHQPGATKAAYLAALEAQVAGFPDDPNSGEARWLLGKLRLGSNRPDDAMTLWSKIQHGHPRWLEAQTAAADLAITAVQDQWVNRDSTAVRPKVEAARALIRRALDQAAEGAELIGLGLRLARLESIPGVGQPAEALLILDRLLKSPASADEHRAARLGRIVALAELNRFTDAEVVARNEAKVEDLESLLPPLRLLDQAAVNTEGDLIRKRTGTLIRILLARWVEPIDRTPGDARDEVRLRQVRALLFTGDTLEGRRVLARWGGPTGGTGDVAFLRDLGDTYFRLEAYALAVDVEKLRASKLPAGSPAWFDARYSLALALFRSDRARDARKILDATAILHPDLGGGETRDKFARLSQKIGVDPG